jgi:precorrin-8X/cobalt-precorrin-8 methylmutase
VWPFETGLRAPDGLVVLAEAWPSQLKTQACPGQVKDQAQVQALAEHFAKLDRAGALGRLFEGPSGLSEEQRRVVEQEEGWILGVL